MPISFSRVLRPLAGLIFCVYALTPLLAQDKVPAEQVLPPDTLALVSIPSVTEMSSRFDETVWSDLFTNPEMTKLWDSITKPATKELDKLADEYGFDWKQLTEIPTGEISVSLTRVKRGEIGVTFAIEYDDNSESLVELLDKLEENLEKATKSREVTSSEGTDIVSYELSPKEASNKQHLCWFLKDGFFVASNSVGALEAILVRWDGEKTEVLSEQEDFKYIRERCRIEGTEPVAYWYLNPLLALRSVLEMGQSATQQALVQAFLPRLGLDKLRAIGGSVDLATEQYEEVTQTVFYVDEPRIGFLKMFQASSVAMTPPDWVSEECESFVIYHWGLEGALGEVKTLVDSFQGVGAFDRLLDQFADHPGARGLHPQKDFIDLLSGTVIVEVTPPVSEDAEAPPVNLFAAELKDAKRLGEILDKLQQLDGSGMETRDFQGDIIYTLPVSAGMKLNLTVAQNSLFVSNSEDRIEQILRGGDKKLKDSPAFQKLSSEAPDSAGFWGMQQTGTQLERATNQIPKLVESIVQVLKSLTQGASDIEVREILENMPSTEVLKKYTTDTFFYITEDERGAYWKSYSLRKQQ